LARSASTFCILLRGDNHAAKLRFQLVMTLVTSGMTNNEEIMNGRLGIFSLTEIAEQGPVSTSKNKSR
jgi:hypothetical protein